MSDTGDSRSINSEEEDVAFRASTYRSQTIRDDRDRRNELDLSILGPTKVKALPWSKHLSVLLCGVKDPKCSLSTLAGYEASIVKTIYEMLVDTWKQHIILTPPAHAVGRAVADCAWCDEEATAEDYEQINHVFVGGCCGIKRLGRTDTDRPEVAFSLVGTVQFPEPTGRNVNMLPFIMGNKNSLPEDLRPYYDTLIARCPVEDEEYGKVLYLTISEAVVEASSTQRRSGLHVEAAAGISGVEGEFLAGTESNWGGGVRSFFYDDEGEPDKYSGGLFMASNVESTCEIWDALVAKGEGIVDYHGGGDHLRPFIGNGTKLKANELAWLTDRTPHQALPQANTGYRQFFRLVTSNISIWFKQHSTSNPKVPVPDHVLIIDEDKFASGTAGPGGVGEEKPPAKKIKT